MRLVRRQAELDAGFRHGFDEIENVGGAGPGNGGDRIERVLGLDPQEFARGRQDLLDELASGAVDGFAGVEAGHALAHERGRVRHRSHHALRAEPAGDALGGDAGGDAQVQCVGCEATHGRRRLRESLRLDSPDHDLAACERGPGFGLRGDAEVVFEPRTRLCERLDHLEGLGGHILLDEAADDGAGHVAAPDEADGRQGRGLPAGQEGDGDVHGVSVNSKAANWVICSGLKLSSLTTTSMRLPLGRSGPQHMPSVLSRRERPRLAKSATSFFGATV